MALPKQSADITDNETNQFADRWARVQEGIVERTVIQAIVRHLPELTG